MAGSAAPRCRAPEAVEPRRFALPGLSGKGSEPHAINRLAGLSTDARSVAIELRACAFDGAHACTVSNDTLQARTGLCLTRLRFALNELVAFGLYYRLMLSDSAGLAALLALGFQPPWPEGDQPRRAFVPLWRLPGADGIAPTVARSSEPQPRHEPPPVGSAG